MIAAFSSYAQPKREVGGVARFALHIIPAFRMIDR
jgi:hypothetical protein